MDTLLPKSLNTFWISLAAGVGFLGVSLLGYAYPELEPFLFGALVIGVAILGALRPAWLIYAVVVEMLVGSTGRLLELPLVGMSVSIRMALFALALIMGIVIWIQHPERRLFQWSRTRKWRADFFVVFVMLLCMIVIGVVNGVAHGFARSNIFLDANNYFFFLLLLVLPIFFSSWSHVKESLSVLFGALTALWVETTALFLIFSHRLIDLTSLYRWTRVNHLAEVTIQDGGWVRVFSQSHIFALLLLLVSVFILRRVTNLSRRDQWMWTWILWISMFMVIVSFSRSFWLAAVVTLGLSFVTGRLWREGMRPAMRAVGYSLGAFIVSIVVLFGLIHLPIPGGPSISLGSVEDRATDLEGEVALGSRFRLLSPLLATIRSAPILGTGFGTSVTYETLDPRYIDVTKQTTYTTFTFEWGYLDTITEMGIVGLGVLGWLLLLIGARLWRASQREESVSRQAFLLGLLFSEIALLVTHAVTPYLNHPLGIFWMILLATIALIGDSAYSVLKRNSV